MGDRRFPVAYKVVVNEKLTATELKARDLGGCDAVIIHSIIYPADGSRSEVIIGHDGRTDTDLSEDELFKSWAMLGHRLAQSTTLGIGRKALCEMVHEALRRVVAGKCNHPAVFVKPTVVDDDTEVMCWLCQKTGRSCDGGLASDLL